MFIDELLPEHEAYRALLKMFEFVGGKDQFVGCRDSQ